VARIMFFLTPYKILWQTITIVCLSLNTFHSALHGQAGFGVVGEGQCANCTDCCAYIGVDEQVELEAELTPKDEIANDSEIVWSASGPVGANMKFNGAAYNPNNPPTGKSVNFETDTAGDYTISSFCKSCGGASVCLKAIGECLMGWGHWTIPPAWTNNGDGTYTTPGPIGGAHPLSN
ncbi:MAG: hypothetical protein MI725_00910, partial [Pirellulales bacterium]|nr:hypothetical protein [Pirellulales bacterium]